MNCGKITLIVLLDLSTTFDTVDHSILPYGQLFLNRRCCTWLVPVMPEWQNILCAHWQRDIGYIATKVRSPARLCSRTYTVFNVHLTHGWYHPYAWPVVALLRYTGTINNEECRELFGYHPFQCLTEKT